MDHEGATCWDGYILPTSFLYLKRDESPFWTKQVRWEWRTFSKVGRFVPYYLCCSYGLRESGRNQFSICITPTYRNLELPRGFRFEQESIFTYKSRQFTHDRGTGLWVLAYTERVVGVWTALIVAAYDEFVLWHLPPDVFKFGRQLGMAMGIPLGSLEILREVLELLDIIESTQLSSFPDIWRKR